MDKANYLDDKSILCLFNNLQLFVEKGSKQKGLTTYNPEFAARQMLDGGKL